MNGRILKKKAYAKINLSLDVLGRRDDGYHIVDMVMQQIRLCDDIEIEVSDSGDKKISLDVTDLRNSPGDAGHPGLESDKNKSALQPESEIPTDRKNLMYKAAELMTDSFGLTVSLRLRLIKKIPSEAGLGGGSADAAAVITGINELLSLGAMQEELLKLGAKIGSDVPFCIMGGTVRAEGTGTVMTRLRNLAEVMSEAEGVPQEVLLVKLKAAGSTPKIYAAYDEAVTAEGDKIKHPDTNKLAEAINTGDAEKIRKTLIDNNINVLEHAAKRSMPVVKLNGKGEEGLISAIKHELISLGAVTAAMTGSGSVIYGLFDSRDEMQQAGKMLSAGELSRYIEGIYETKLTCPEMEKNEVY